MYEIYIKASNLGRIEEVLKEVEKVKKDYPHVTLNVKIEIALPGCRD